MTHEVIYLTGIAGVGKSTLSSRLNEQFSNLMILEYGALLTQFIAKKTGQPLEQRDLKEKSSQLITQQDVAEVDDWLVEEVRKKREHCPLVIDSHAVTIEAYGFRITPFSAEKIKRLSPTRIVLLTASASDVVRRVSIDSGGRPIPTIEQATRHSALQLAVAVNYSILVGVPMYEVGNDNDSSNALELLSQWLT